MYNLLEDLLIRHTESDHYISLLKLIDSSSHSITSDNDETLKVNIELKNTMKGLTFLLFYNTIESTLRESILRIYDSFRSNSICFNALRDEIKKYIIDHMKKNISSERFIRMMNDLSLDICHKTIDSSKIFSGNIDRETINDTAKIYGFSTDSNYASTKHGEYLKKIKDNRNDLAHGNLSFSEIGKNTTIQDLEEIHKYLLNYLENILAKIEQYLHQKNYLN